MTQSNLMNEKFILNILDKFEKSPAVLLHIKEGETELTLKKEAAYRHNLSEPYLSALGTQCMPVQAAPAAPFSQAAAPHYAVQAAEGAAPASETAADAGSAIAAGQAASPTAAADKSLITVKSPIVGSFYRSPSPDAPAYVEKGTAVSKGQALCILEAMKMLNTLESEYDGVIEDILASNGDLVEFDQPLFVIRISS